MDFSSYKTWRNIAIAVLAICFILYISSSSNPEITMDPIKDAQTCIKLYEKDEARGTAYMQEVISTYYMQGKHDEHDQFAKIVTKRMAEIDFQ